MVLKCVYYSRFETAVLIEFTLLDSIRSNHVPQEPPRVTCFSCPRPSRLRWTSSPGDVCNERLWRHSTSSTKGVPVCASKFQCSVLISEFKQPLNDFPKIKPVLIKITPEFPLTHTLGLRTQSRCFSLMRIVLLLRGLNPKVCHALSSNLNTLYSNLTKKKNHIRINNCSGLKPKTLAGFWEQNRNPFESGGEYR